MARGPWRRRTIIISVIIVALTVGIVFASLPYLQPPTTPHASIAGTLSHTVGPGNPSHPGFYALRLPNITANEAFYVKVNVTSGTASFCVLEYQQYENWAFAINTPQNYTFPSGDCIFGPTQQTSLDTLKFSITPGTWVVAALNYSPSELTVYFSQA